MSGMTHGLVCSPFPDIRKRTEEIPCPLVVRFEIVMLPLLTALPLFHPALQKIDDGLFHLLLSYLKPEEQALLVETMESEQATPSLSQAQRMKRMSQEGKLTEGIVSTVLTGLPARRLIASIFIL